MGIAIGAGIRGRRTTPELDGIVIGAVASSAGTGSGSAAAAAAAFGVGGADDEAAQERLVMVRRRLVLVPGSHRVFWFRIKIDF